MKQVQSYDRNEKTFCAKIRILPYRRYKSTSASSNFSLSWMWFMKFFHNITWFMNYGWMSFTFFKVCSILTNISGFKFIRTLIMYWIYRLSLFIKTLFQLFLKQYIIKEVWEYMNFIFQIVRNENKFDFLQMGIW